MSKNKIDPQIRFNKKFIKSNKCWEWIGAKDSSGYGRFWTGKKNTGAHQYSYTITKGTIPNKMVVMHTCDNSLCVNPEHLNIGTQKDNIQDMYIKSRNRKKETYTSGHNHHLALFTKKQVANIRNIYLKGNISWSKLAKKFGASKRCIGNILQNNTYKYE